MLITTLVNIIKSASTQFEQQNSETYLYIRPRFNISIRTLAYLYYNRTMTTLSLLYLNDNITSIYLYSRRKMYGIRPIRRKIQYGCIPKLDAKYLC